jgi:2,3-bisphosphoglycerate-independent phosphoglycerate mutase
MTRPVILIIMDGVGIGDGGPGDAVARADMPGLRALMENNPHTFLKAHGTAVGLPTDEDIGNSEVGHNTLGSGQIYSQGASLINESIESGSLWEGKTWRQLVDNCLEKDSVMHFIGLLSDGNVHSNIAHLFAMLDRCMLHGVRRSRVHILLDGRDVPPYSSLDYVDRLEAKLSECRAAGFDYRISTGGGRMVITMDRYEADWGMVALGWRTHVLGEGRRFASAREAIETYRREIPGVTDQNLPPFVVAEDSSRVEKMTADDSVILFNYRGDRAIELSQAFDDEEFDKFERGPEYPRMYAGILEYDTDRKVPKRYLLEPPQIKNTLTDLLNSAGIAQFAVSETQKFGHATYFWNGNRSGVQCADLETYCEIPSDIVSFDQAPRMQSEKIASALIKALETGRYGFLRCNFPNGDMVGHTGNFRATVEGLQAVDAAIRRIQEAAKKANAVLIVTADHGNAEDMLSVQKDGTATARTSHSLNPVPFVIYDPERVWKIKEGLHTLANVAPTIAALLGLKPYDCWEESLLE